MLMRWTAVYRQNRWDRQSLHQWHDKAGIRVSGRLLCLSQEPRTKVLSFYFPRQPKTCKASLRWYRSGLSVSSNWIVRSNSYGGCLVPKKSNKNCDSYGVFNYDVVPFAQRWRDNVLIRTWDFSGVGNVANKFTSVRNSPLFVGQGLIIFSKLHRWTIKSSVYPSGTKNWNKYSFQRVSPCLRETTTDAII